MERRGAAENLAQMERVNEDPDLEQIIPNHIEEGGLEFGVVNGEVNEGVIEGVDAARDGVIIVNGEREIEQVPEVGALGQNLPINVNLPNEIQAMIGERIQGFHNQLVAREVSRGLRMGVERALAQPISFWKSNFENFTAFARSINGTRISNWEQAQNFIDDMDGVAIDPFPNGTLIFTPLPHLPPIGLQMQQSDLIRFYNLFSIIVARFGTHIRRLVYCFQPSDIVNYMQLCGELCCIYNLQNLESLAVYRAEMALTVENYDFIHEEFLPSVARYNLPNATLPLVRELLIFGRDDVDTHAGVPSLIRSLCGAVMETCESLQFPLSDGFAVSRSRFYANQRLIVMPNLRRLKLFGKLLRLHEIIFFRSEITPPQLNDVGVKIHLSRNMENFNPLVINNLFASIPHLRIANLTQFRLMLTDTQVRHLRNLFVDGLFRIQFPTVTDFTVGTSLLLKWTNITDMFSHLFPNLRILHLDIDERNPLSFMECRRYCVELHRQFLFRLDLIKVHALGRGFRADGSFVLLADLD